MAEASFTLARLRGRAVIRCALCGALSANLHDVIYRYCGRCHLFHEAVAEARRLHRAGGAHDCAEWGSALGACAICAPAPAADA